MLNLVGMHERFIGKSLCSVLQETGSEYRLLRVFRVCVCVYLVPDFDHILPSKNCLSFLSFFRSHH